MRSLRRSLAGGFASQTRNLVTVMQPSGSPARGCAHKATQFTLELQNSAARKIGCGVESKSWFKSRVAPKAVKHPDGQKTRGIARPSDVPQAQPQVIQNTVTPD
jgi:hypothetical protein